MSWLSKKWDQLSGKNQKISQNTIKNEYEDAFGGARKTYGALEERGMDMMDPNSQFNLQQKERMEGSAADAAAMSSRMAGRNAAMSGGANAASLAAQTASGANQAQAGAIGAYNQYLSGAMSSGAGMASGAANNMAQMNQTQMNALQANRQANNQIDSQATAFNANMLGKGLNKIFQEGGQVGAEDFKPHLMYKGDVKKMANTYEQHLELKKSGYNHQREMAKGGFLSKLLRAEKEMMPSQEEIEDMKYGDGNDNYHYRDMRRPMHRIDRNPDMLPLPASIDDSAPRVRGDDESYQESADTRLQYDGTLSNEHQDNLKMMREQVMKYHQVPESLPISLPRKQEGGKISMYQKGGYAESSYGNKGGMLSQVMGPDGMPMNIRTRIGGQIVGE